MRVFLDARDLIGILENALPCSVPELGTLLTSGSHVLALTPTVVSELSAPLIACRPRSVVTRLLNALETLPLSYIASTQIPPRELHAAISAFVQDREYSPADPYVLRFDAAIPHSGPAPTALYLHHSLAETVFTIWQKAPEVFRWPDAAVERLRRLLESDRALPNPPNPRAHFREKIRRDLESNGVATRTINVDALADWIRESPARCPALRLRYEVYHQLRRNLEDAGNSSDLGDFAHVLCLPYIDLMTLDARMSTYVKQATRTWHDSPGDRVFSNCSDLLSRLIGDARDVDGGGAK